MKCLKKNIGTTDQVIRIIISLLLIYIGFIDESIIGDSLSSMVLGILGCMSLMVAIIRICPLYTVCNINTDMQHLED
ncbi:MAG: DUF2892 domain-containing protein [Gammaproteobacteria bacterium]|nr:DUF2892 domain-containing protein [Gammaproteobacteria bacterium]